MAVGFSISEIRELSEQLSVRLKLPFNQMTHSFLRRRLAMFFDQYGIRKVDQFYERLNDDSFADELIRFFIIDTTELLRDAGFWRQLRSIIRDKLHDKRSHVWLPSVASGEELYSLVILLDELGLRQQFKITVNHPSEKAIDKIKKGVINKRQMEINAFNYKRFEGMKGLADYIIESDGEQLFDTSLLSEVEFKKGSLHTVPDAPCDVIILRNSLLYYTKDYHEELKNLLDGVLVSGGYLCLGVKEQLPQPFDNRFECIDKKEKIYNKFSFLRD